MSVKVSYFTLFLPSLFRKSSKTID